MVDITQPYNTYNTYNSRLINVFVKQPVDKIAAISLNSTLREKSVDEVEDCRCGRFYLAKVYAKRGEDCIEYYHIGNELRQRGLIGCIQSRTKQQTARRMDVSRRCL